MIEKNTVVLSIKDYNELRDFKQNMIKNNAYVVNFGGSLNDAFSISFVSNDEMMKDVIEANKRLKEKYDSLEKKNYELNYDNESLELENTNLKLEIKHMKPEKKKELTIDDMKKWSIWQFRKWKNQWYKHDMNEEL